MRLVWDKTGERTYETGVDRMALYLYDTQTKTCKDAVAWNGITAFNESPSGAEPTALYADNIKYLNLMSAEEYGATLEAYTYPEEFEECDGSKEIAPGVIIGQQNRRLFAVCYRTLIGDDVEGTEKGYKLHIVYNCLASPSERSHATVNDSPEAANPSWTISTTPVEVSGGKPTATITIDSTAVDPEALASFEDIVYGDLSNEGRLPFPDEIASIFGGGVQPSILLDRHTLNLVEDDTFTLTPTTTPAGETVTFSSASTSVATVGENTGVVTAEGAGNTIVTASMTKSGVTYTDTCTVIVTAKA